MSTSISGESRDQFGRKIEYLRISVTDRCNFRCQYCMPLEGLPWLPKADILRYEEIADVVRQLAPMGLRRLRITGGEPTIRPQLATLVRMLRDIPGIEDIALSTNGVKLPTMAAELAEAGLDRVNISADSLRPDRVVKIARRDLHFDLVASARAAQAAGLGPIKINVVVMRGINDDEIADFAALTRDNPWHVRFIELMPVGEMSELTFDHVVPTDEVLARIRAVDTLEPDAGPARGNGPAVYYRYPSAAGTVGVITPMTHTYCERCNRCASRLTGGCGPVCSVTTRCCCATPSGTIRRWDRCFFRRSLRNRRRTSCCRCASAVCGPSVRSAADHSSAPC